MVHETASFLLRHGYLVLFGWVFVEQIGLAVPSLPMLLAAGALSAQGELSLAASLGVATLAALISDNVWYHLGRRRGYRVLRALCRITLEPDSCIRRTQGLFDRYGHELLIFSKFVPALGTFAVPMAGASRMKLRRFLLLDGCGALLWAGVFIGLGKIFSNQLDRLAAYGLSLGAVVGALVIAVLVAYLGWKVIRRHQALRRLRMVRIVPEALKQQLDLGKSVMIVDLRHRREVEADPEIIPGALHFDPKELADARGKIAIDRDVVLYCACPNEASAAHAALLLRKQGIKRVRPLAEGLDGWRKRGFPVERWAELNAPAARPAEEAAGA